MRVRRKSRERCTPSKTTTGCEDYAIRARIRRKGYVWKNVAVVIKRMQTLRVK